MPAEYDFDSLLKERVARNAHFRSHYASPIPEEHLPAFNGLSYFAPAPEWSLSGEFTARSGKIEIVSSTGRTTAYRIAGSVRIDIQGESFDLLVLHGEEDDRYVPFRDATCGDESYGGGRYVSVSMDNGSAHVDFNRAVNPWCAYDDEFSCPLPPPQNRLPMRIEAGEKDYRSPRRGNRFG